MLKLERVIMGTALYFLVTSLLYLLALLAGVPVWLPALASIVSLAMLVYLIAPQAAAQVTLQQAVMVVLIGLAAVIYAWFKAKKYGEWDADYIWNLHAKYLASPQYWRNLFQNTKYAHPDYPLLLPSAIGFLWRMFPQSGQLAPFGVAFLFLLGTPLLLFSRLSRLHFTVAAICLLLLTSNAFFLALATDQYADVPLAFFLLASWVSLENVRTTSQPRMQLLLAGAMMGAMVSTKNEGLMLALLLLLWHLPLLRAQRCRLWLLPTLLAPLAITLGIKWAFAPPNDLVDGLQPGWWHLLHRWARYQEIWRVFWLRTQQDFALAAAVIAGAAVAGLGGRRPLLRSLGFPVLAMLCYAMVYLLTSHDLTWHLETSINRLMMHLLPLTIYLLGRNVATLLSARGSTAVQQF